MAPIWGQDGPQKAFSQWKINVFAVEGHLSPKMAQDGLKMARVRVHMRILGA